MKRNLKNSIDRYEELAKENKLPRSAYLTVEEMFKIRHMSRDEAGEDSIYDAIMNAWNAGYMACYDKRTKDAE